MVPGNVSLKVGWNILGVSLVGDAKSRPTGDPAVCLMHSHAPPTVPHPTVFYTQPKDDDN